MKIDRTFFGMNIDINGITILIFLSYIQINQQTKITAEAQYKWDILTNEIFFGYGWQFLFGYTTKVLSTFDDWETRIHPNDKKVFFQDLDAFISQAGSDKFIFRYRFLKADGNYAHVADKGRIVRDNKGKGLNMSGIVLDETAYFQKQKELEELTSLRLETVEKALEGIGKNLNDDVLQHLAAAKLILEAGLHSPINLEQFSKMSLDSIEYTIKEVRRLNNRYSSQLEISM